MEIQEQELNKDEFKYEQEQHELVEESYEDSDIADALVQAKVSDDGGETWTRRTINLGGDIDESGLKAGEIFQLNGEKYRVLSGDFGLAIEQVRKPASGKKVSKRK